MKRWLLICAACAVSSRAASLQSQGALFVYAAPVAVGPGSGQILLVDVNRDGRLDMVTRHLLQRRLGVFLGDGTGAFAAAPQIALDYQPGGIAAADVNSDGITDLVSTKSEGDEVDVFLGDGKGGFARAAGSPFAASPSRDFYTRSVDIADVNEDRRLDLIVANGHANAFAILYGDGRGGFSPGPIVARDTSEPQRHTFAFGDVDGDGHLDAVIASRGGEETSDTARVSVLRGDGTGAFKDVASALVVPAGPQSMALADVNGDRRPDLAIAHSHTRSLTILLNAGRGMFAPAARSRLDVGNEVFGVIVADANGDGQPDLLAGSADSATVLLNDGRGRFAPAPGSPFRAGPGAYRLSAADINGDGKLDLAVPSFEGSTVTVLLGR